MSCNGFRIPVMLKPISFSVFLSYACTGFSNDNIRNSSNEAITAVIEKKITFNKTD